MSSEPRIFSIRRGEDTAFSATINFTPEDDICGEGYDGYSYEIAFDNPQYRSRLWIFPYVRASSEDEIMEEATTSYDDIVSFIKAVRS